MTEQSSLFLFANLGPEVSRLFSLMKKNEYEHAFAARERAEHIIGELRRRPDMKVRLPELDILSSVLSDVVEKERQFVVSAEDMESYFQPFMQRLMAQTV